MHVSRQADTRNIHLLTADGACVALFWTGYFRLNRGVWHLSAVENLITAVAALHSLEENSNFWELNRLTPPPPTSKKEKKKKKSCERAGDGNSKQMKRRRI